MWIQVKLEESRGIDQLIIFGNQQFNFLQWEEYEIEFTFQYE